MQRTNTQHTMTRHAKTAVKIDGKQYNRGDILPERAADAATLELYTKTENTIAELVSAEAGEEIVAEVKPSKVKVAKADKTEEATKTEEKAVKTDDKEGADKTVETKEVIEDVK